jgi:hypothetical protein
VDKNRGDDRERRRSRRDWISLQGKILAIRPARRNAGIQRLDVSAPFPFFTGTGVCASGIERSTRFSAGASEPRV